MIWHVLNSLLAAFAGAVTAGVLGRRDGYQKGQRDAEREAAENLDGQIDQALRLANPLADDTDFRHRERIERARGDE